MAAKEMSLREGFGCKTTVAAEAQIQASQPISQRLEKFRTGEMVIIGFHQRQVIQHGKRVEQSGVQHVGFHLLETEAGEVKEASQWSTVGS